MCLRRCRRSVREYWTSSNCSVHRLKKPAWRPSKRWTRWVWRRRTQWTTVLYSTTIRKVRTLSMMMSSRFGRSGFHSTRNWTMRQISTLTLNQKTALTSHSVSINRWMRPRKLRVSSSHARAGTSGKYSKQFSSTYLPTNIRLMSSRQRNARSPRYSRKPTLSII